MYPTKDFDKFGQKNAGPPPPILIFPTTPNTPSKEFENDCASMEN